MGSDPGTGAGAAHGRGGRLPVPVRRALVAGLAGSAAVTGSAAVVHVLVPDVAFLPLAIAQRVVRVAPGGFATALIEALGAWAIRLAVIGASAAFLLSGLVAGAALPVLARVFRGRTGPAWAVAFLVLWAAAALLYPEDAVSASRAVFAAVTLPLYLFGAAAAAWAGGRLAAPAEPWRLRPDLERRYVLRSLAVGTAGLVLGAVNLGGLVRRRPDPGLRPLVVAGLDDLLPPAEGPADRAFSRIAGLAAEVTSNDGFYVVDEEIIDPDIDPDTWRLTVRGKVRRTLSLTHRDLLRLPLDERFQTLECISNEVGGDLISTAKWVGVPLPRILERAGVDPRSAEVVFTATSGYADSLSVEQAMDDSTWIAVGMNDRVLPRAHGFPARLLSVGTYGMKNPKWLVDIEVVEGAFEGYWQRRGWTKDATVKTGSRIDTVTPRDPGTGLVTAAGVAFAGDRGISRVEVSTDGGSTWAAATLKRPLSGVSWRLWSHAWQPVDGRATVVVRAFDGRGEPQTADRADPHPSGASGYHALTVRG